MQENDDQIYANQRKTYPFKFDEQVAGVFSDMIKRSVPGYSDIIKIISKLASQFIVPVSNCYDLGCSLGAASLAMSHGNLSKGVTIYGVDNSEAMLTRCQSKIEAFRHKTPIKLVHDDICDIKVVDASLVILNYTLQFIEKDKREKLLANIFDGMLPGSALVLSEKVIFEDAKVNQLMIDLHHQFKRENGYSELEISQKRSALDNVLIPESIQAHKERLNAVGFAHVSCFIQQLNFASFIAIKN